MSKTDIDKEDSDGPAVEGRWSQQEHTRFLSAVFAHGKNWPIIQREVQSRNNPQVRSHAQKFFMKIKKLEKERKKSAKKGVKNPSPAEMMLLQSFSQHTLTTNTPPEILHFLKVDPSTLNSSISFQKIKQHKSRGQLILQEMLLSNEEQSFLISLIKRSAWFLERQQGIAELIDFPLANDEEETANNRKRSFSLYDEEEDQIKYHSTVLKMKAQEIRPKKMEYL